jgi:uncharacterized membrane protein HdeD (DUF308 family)
MIEPVLIGGIAALSLVAALFFLRYWRASRDRFFLLFALSFALEGINRVVLFLYVGPDEYGPFYYLIRLVAYGLILLAIVGKNRAAQTRPRARESGDL